MIERAAVRWTALLVVAVVAGILLWNAHATAQAPQAAKPQSKAQTAAQADQGSKEKKTTSPKETKAAHPASRMNAKSAWITIDSSCVSNADDAVHAPKKSEGGLVVFSADGDFTIEFQYPDFWRGSANKVPVSKNVGAALFVDSEGGKFTHFCMHGPGCAPCPASWPPALKPGQRPMSDPNDIVVP